MNACNFAPQLKLKCPPRRTPRTPADLHSLVVLHADVARAGNQHDAHVLQRAFDDVHVLVQVAGRRLGGVRQEGVLEVHAQSLGEVVVPKRQAALVEQRGRSLLAYTVAVLLLLGCILVAVLRC